MPEKIFMDWKNDNGEHFESHAEDFLRPVYPWLLRDLENATERSLRGMKILELGCGPGFMLEQFLAAHAKKVVGLDLSHKMLLRARNSGRAGAAQLIQADACNLPFIAESFDIVFSRGSVFFWNDIERAMHQIKNILKPSGTALIGGGYGLSTPQVYIDAIIQHYALQPKSKIPRLDFTILQAIANKIGGKTEILQAKKRGFWLKWQI
ncbi:MAG: class I SAM-dependent methyltransferase [Erysipelotrichia bacterium]|nr:class I SAM-dependent methyltransferase [Erysipelotrichia bacterium]